MDLRNEIRDAMLEQDVIPYGLAQSTGIDRSQLHRYLNAQADLPGERLGQILEVLDMEIARPIVPTLSAAGSLALDVAEFARDVNEVVSHGLPGRSRHPLAVRARRLLAQLTKRSK